MTIHTADLCDQYPEELTFFTTDFKHYGATSSFFGQVVTLKVYEDNSFVRRILEEQGIGKVLVVDGGGSKRCALVGDNIAKLAIENGWSGIIVYGCIRDSSTINQMEIGIRAIGTCPVKSIKRNVGIEGEDLLIDGVRIRQDQYIYADQDGILIADKKLVLS